MRNNQAIHVAVAAVLIGVSTIVAAQNAGTIGELSVIQTDTLILKAKAARAAAQLELNKSSSSGSVSRAADLSGDAVDAIRFRGVNGVGGKRAASAVLNDGTTRMVRVGETVAGVKIVKIGIDEVTVSARGREVVVPVIPQEEQPRSYGAGASPMPLPGSIR